MQVPTPTESSHAGGYTPFMIHQKRLDKVSASSSMLSDSSQGASSSAGTGQLCTCSSLAGCSSLQLQEQHLLAAGNSSSNACRTAEDMFVLVLPRGNHEKSATGADKQKPRQSLGGASDQHSASGSKAHHWMRQFCRQSPKHLTQELLLRLVAVLLVVLATVGLAYRLAKKNG